MKQKINIGVLGLASIAKRYIIPTLVDHNDFQLVGIGTRNESNHAAHIANLSTPIFNSYQSLLNLPELEAVYIPLPNALHYEWIKKALNQGLHVIVEKSMTCTSGETRELNELAKEKQLVLLENFQFRFHTQLDALKRMINEGQIGAIRSVRSAFGFPPFADKNNIRYNPELGGGALLDAGAYGVKISQILLGSNLKVQGAALNMDDQYGVDTFGSALLKVKDSAITAHIAFGFDHQYQCNVEVWGSEGKITLNRVFTAPPGFEPKLILERGNEVETIELPADNHFNNMFRHFAQLIENKADRAAEYNQNIVQAELLASIKQQANA